MTFWQKLRQLNDRYIRPLPHRIYRALAGIVGFLLLAALALVLVSILDQILPGFSAPIRAPKELPYLLAAPFLGVWAFK